MIIRLIRPPHIPVPTAIAVLASAILLLQAASAAAAPFDTDEPLLHPFDPPFIDSHLYKIQLQVLYLEEESASGGAIEPLGDKLLVVMPRGRIAVVHADGAYRYLPQQVPMNAEAAEPTVWPGFRVADILLRQLQPHRFTLFVSHHYFAGDCVEFRISSTTITLDQDEVSISDSWKTEFTANPCVKIPVFEPVFRGAGGLQAGGRLLMDGADRLLVVVGDHKWYEWHEWHEPDFKKKQPLVDPDHHLGKLVRIDLTSGAAEIVAAGLRNPQGLARDAEGNLWETEHGPHGGDELNLLQPGLDYGWPHVTYGLQYRNLNWPFSESQSRHDGYEEPIFTWIPSIGISNLIVVDSQQFPLWQNDLLIASLREQSLFRARIVDGRVSHVEPIKIGLRIRDIAQLPDGRIALWTDDKSLIFLQRAPFYCHERRDSEHIYTYDAAEACTDLAPIIDEADDPLVRAIDLAKIDEPLIHALFTVYAHDNQLVYVRTPCSERDLSPLFLLHITPAHPLDLNEESESLGINNHDFYVDEEGAGVAVEDGVCIVTRARPDYEAARVYTGQAVRVESEEGEISWIGPVWDGFHVFDRPTLANAEIAALTADSDDLVIRSLRDTDFGAPLASAFFDIRIHANWIIYARSGCGSRDLANRFFLHITPAHPEDLAEETKNFGFNVYDFNSSDRFVGAAVDNSGCVIARALPQYEIKHIYTGQVVRVVNEEGEESWKGPLWEAKMAFDDAEPEEALEGENDAP